MAALLPLAGPLSADDGDGGYRLLELDGYKVKWGDQILGAEHHLRLRKRDDVL